MVHFHLKSKKSSLLDKPLTSGITKTIWTKVATLVVTLVFVSTLSFSYFLPELDFRLSLLLTGLIFLGMPHGAMDVYILCQLLKSKNRLLLGIVTYVGISLPILFLWPLYPTACFLFFLSYSLVHFADSDMQDRTSSVKLKAIEFMARLNLPFCLPYIFHREQTLKLVQWIHPDVNLLAAENIFLVLGTLSLSLVAIHTSLGFMRLARNLKDADIAFIEPLVISVLFILINPLYAFGIYFCFIHSVKHLVNVLLRIKINSPLTVLPYWLVPLMGLPILFFIFSKNQEVLQQKVFQYIIIVLSSLALPHAFLIRYGKSRLMIN